MSLDLALSLSVVFLAVASLVVRFWPRGFRRGGESCGCRDCPGSGLTANRAVTARVEPSRRR